MTLEAIDLDLPLVYKDVNIRVRKQLVKATEFFIVAFEDKRPNLALTLGKKLSGKPFWTSIPEGRQKEAQEIGYLIDNHFKLL